MHGFLRTSLTISWYYLIKLGPIRGAWMIGHGVIGVIKALGRKPGMLSFKRNVACRNCSMYDSDFGTCGPVDEFYKDADGIVHPLGCHCIVRLANRIHKKDCWARFNGLNFGWESAIRPPLL